MEGSDKPSLKFIWWVSSNNTIIHFFMVPELFVYVGITVSNRWRHLQQKASKKLRHLILFQLRLKRLGFFFFENSLAFPCMKGWRWEWYEILRGIIPPQPDMQYSLLLPWDRGCWPPTSSADSPFRSCYGSLWAKVGWGKDWQIRCT